MKPILFLLALGLTTASQGSPDRIINGIEVPPGMFDQVVILKINGSTCSASQVGPSAFLTTAHCGKDGALVEIQAGNTTLQGSMIVSSLYPDEDHDLAVVITKTRLAGQPLSIGGGVQMGEQVQILGYGCTDSSGGGAMSTLRMGDTQVSSFKGYDFITKAPNGAAVCFGDSGGPAVQRTQKGYVVQGIHSKGNIKDTNYHTNLSSPASQRFLNDVATTHNISICGVNADCGQTVVTAAPRAPRCELTATPAFIELGDSIDFSLTVSGLAEEVRVETLGKVDVPTGGFEFSVTPQQEGVHELEAEVSGPGGQTQCFIQYGVK